MTATAPAVLLFTTLLTCFGARASSQEIAVGQKQQREEEFPSLTVNGQGEASASPDRATVQFGAEVQASEANAAQSAVNAAMQKAVAAAQGSGISEGAIQTTGLSLSPVYAPHQPGQESQAPRVVAYRASNGIRIRIDDLSQIGKVIDVVLAAGANRLEGVSFELQNDLPHRARALTAAVKEAQTKARTMAGALQVELLEIREVAEGGVTFLPRQENFATSRIMAMDSAPTPVQPGEVRVQASVTLRYRMAPAKASTERPAKAPGAALE